MLSTIRGKSMAGKFELTALRKATRLGTIFLYQYGDVYLHPVYIFPYRWWLTVGQIVNQKLFSFNTFIRFFIISTIFRSSKYIVHRKMSISPLDFFPRRYEPTHSAVIPSSSNTYLHVVKNVKDTYANC